MADPASPTGVEASSGVDVVVSDEQTEMAIDAPRWAALAAAVLRREGAHGELTLTFVDRAEIAALNREHMGEDGPTDVLSFPLDAGDAYGDHLVGPVLLGDVVVCPAVAAEAAPSHAGTVDDELALLTVHGVLHVLGHDHAEPDEARLMRAREIELLSELHWHGGPPAGFVHEQGAS
ncbi:MAG: rRNA maturation RNase YbeY [Ilumatobacter sp.]|uniref:rRNA maturation RNase YbeY n=1 Tax=Ilumatobacter sp. TaxID=1967498 RepID=UPI002607DD71|nr:rRNA maturation RNase YbeY [Ilumatobacter sp.]MDJ0771636.1 rRNA maturation RNase YbeY [Ilumatobacter sp.]